MGGEGQGFRSPADGGTEELDGLEFDFRTGNGVVVAPIAVLRAPTHVHHPVVERTEAQDDIGLRIEDVEDVVALEPGAGLVRFHEGEADGEVAQSRCVLRGLG